MTSKVTLVGPVGCRPIMVQGSTAPIVYSNEFRETIGCLELLIQRQVQSRGIFVGELDCLQHLVNSILLQSFELPMRTDNGNFLRQLYGATFFTYEARCRDPADKIDPLWRLEWGRLVTTTFTGPLGARSRFTSALSVAAPISSERIGRNQYVAYRRHSVSGVAKDSARRVSEQMYCASFSASLSVKLRLLA